jgi:hypothetical protein
LVRMRAAEGLVDLKSQLPSIFAQVVKTHDRYGLHAFLAALENAGLRNQLDAELRKESGRPKPEIEELLDVLSTGKLPETQVATLEPAPAAARG